MRERDGEKRSRSRGRVAVCRSSPVDSILSPCVFLLHLPSIRSASPPSNYSGKPAWTSLFARIKNALHLARKRALVKKNEVSHPSASGCTSIDRILPTRMSSLVISGASAAAGAAASAAGASTSADLATVEGVVVAGAESDVAVRRETKTDEDEEVEEERRTAAAKAGLATAALAATVASRAPLRAALAI